MENKKVAALVEIGILCRGEDVPTHGDGGIDHGPHGYSGHHQLSWYENPLYQYPFIDPDKPAYIHFPPDTAMEDALSQTRLVVLLGTADTEQLRQCLERPDTIVLVFEPDDRVLVEFLERVHLARLNREGFFLFTGNPYTFNPALQEMLPKKIFELGTPAFFMTDRIREHYQQWAGQVIEYLEILHYRHVIYRVSSQFFSRARPHRDIERTLVYDQQVHAYENILDFLSCPDISQLKNRLCGHTAILVAAGPDLNAKLEYIRRNKDKAVVISVNNALKPLADAGIEPHFTVINDISLAAGRVFKVIPRMKETILVGLCLSDLGGDKFRQKYLFGEYDPDIFGKREMLELHGSVITTAFSLAEYMGCARCVIIGGQLASPSPWGLGYAKGTVNKTADTFEKPLINKHPQLYPVDTPFGETVYTTPNFRDAALWLSEVIRLSKVECVNTSKASILYGRGISYESEPELPEVNISDALAPLYTPVTPRPDYDAALNYIKREIAFWLNVRQVARDVLASSAEAVTGKGVVALKHMDKNNVSYLVERFDDFRHALFYQMVFSRTHKTPEEGFRYYFDHVERMSESFIQLLDEVKQACRAARRA